MKVFRSVEEARAASLPHAVVTLGVFDGVHVGHRVVLDHVRSLARERLGTGVVVTFARHPRALIEKQAPKLLTSIEHKLRIFEDVGVDTTLVLYFDEALRAMSARAFVKNVFVDALSAEVVLLGYNNRFGRGGKGDFQCLADLSGEFGFEARQLEEVRIGEGNVSSTVIRRAILDGRLEEAALMLGRPFSVLGTVVEGQKIGRTIDFPTANLDVHHEVRPPRGVYGCRVRVGEDHHFGLVNIGVRPTVGERQSATDWENRDLQETIEVHLLDYEGDLYGEDLEVVFLTFLRPEKKFEGLAELKEAIQRDRSAFEAWIVGRRTG